MKYFYGIAFLVTVALSACQSPAELPTQNQFSVLSDTLHIFTQKVKGSGLFSLGAGRLHLKDTSEEFAYPIAFPKNVSNIQRAQMYTDFKAIESDFIDIMSGLQGEQEVLVVDQNGNRDFRDDTIRPLREMEWNSSDYSIECQYRRMMGGDTIPAASWVMIGTGHGNILYGRDEHLIADFKLGKNHYRVGAIDRTLGSTFTYGINPQVGLLSQDGLKMDTLFQRDLIKMGEYIDLDGTYYKFDSITHFGEQITLVKENNFNDMVGTQVGMLAPEFQAVSVEGDTIKSEKLVDKPVVIANSCGCGGDKRSTEAFYEIDSAFGGQVHALRLDSGIRSHAGGLQFDMDDAYNKDLSDKYRQAYCSRVCYLVGKNRRILDKFKIVDWADNLYNGMDE